MALRGLLTRPMASLLGEDGFEWPWDSRLVFIATAVLLALITTYAMTSMSARRVKNARSGGKPPQVPYAVPFLGNMLQFVFNTERFLVKTLRRFGSVPFRVKAGPETVYYIPYGEPIQAMFKNSRDLAMKPIIIIAMRDQFGMPPCDVAIFERDGSGGGAKPLQGWEHVDPAHRVFYNQHRDLNVLLNGEDLAGMGARFNANYTARLRETPLVGDGWTELPDLYAFFRDEMFHAACAALVGERFFELCPDFCRDFWAFDRWSLTYLRRTPRWVAPRAYALRERALASVKKWHRYARDHADYRDPAVAGAVYEPVWGARLMRARAEMFDKAGFSADGCASMDLGFLWAANSNAIPAASWVLLHALLSPDLRDRVAAETAECFDRDRDLFDVSALCNKPLLNGMYLEALRYCAATPSARNPVVDDFKLCGWSMPRDSLMLSFSWFGAHDPHFWNTGRVLRDGRAEHPVDAFWAERFLEYPGDPASGPVRKSDTAVYRLEPAEAPPKTAEEDKTAKAISHSAALQGYFYPYGGGSRMCPGRHLARQEILVAVAVMLREFEIELLDPVAAREARPDAKMFATGAMAPDRKLPVRIRRRRGEAIESR